VCVVAMVVIVIVFVVVVVIHAADTSLLKSPVIKFKRQKLEN